MPFARKLITIEVHNLAQAAEEGHTSISWKEYGRTLVNRLLGKSNDEIENRDLHLKTKKQIRNERLEILEKYVRAALVPNETWSDVLRWRSMSHLKSWLRSEYLIAKYGADVREALVAYPQLRLSPQIQPMKYHKRMLLKLFGMLPDGIDKRKTSLPSSPVVVKAFFMEQWNTRKDSAPQLNHLSDLCSERGGEIVIHEGFQKAQLPLEADLSSLSLEDLLELSLGQIVGCGQFNALCEDASIFQLWTKEYISGLALHLKRRSGGFKGKTIVLDVGAGDGLLAHALREEMKAKRTRSYSRTMENSGLNTPTVIATDNGSWGIRQTAPVENLNAQEALAKYCGLEGQQVIVLCSWMPAGEDWTALFRQFNVDEYILIGEYDDGICGDNWLTWGNPAFCPKLIDNQSSLMETNVLTSPIPYVRDGYKRQELDKLVPFQFSRQDTAFSRSSSTISYKRIIHSF
jgi:hypothetical protein